MTKFQENFQKNYVHFERRYSISQRQSSIKHKLTLTFVNHIVLVHKILYSKVHNQHRQGQG